MAFRDLTEFLKTEPFMLPIGGKLYEFPGEISAKSWLQLQRLTEQITKAQAAAALGMDYDPDDEVLSDTDESVLMDEMFGTGKDEMIANGCTSSQIRAVFFTLMAYHTTGIEAAEAMWNAQGEAVAPSRSERRASAKSAPARGYRAASTPRPRKKASPGPKSSSSGT